MLHAVVQVLGADAWFRKRPAARRRAPTAHSRGSFGPTRASTEIRMKKQQTERQADEGKPCHDQAALFPSLETLIEHRLHKISSWKHLRSTRWLVILSSPLIYACAVPFLLLDAAVALYQLVCFPIYGIPKVRREDYLIFDRGRLAYLNTIEKVGCVYCSYANGLLAMITEIAARTEQHFCPIKHAQRLAKTHSRYGKFLPYGDARAYRAESEAVARAYDDLAPGNK
jgi:hypothetical protein